MGGLIPEDVMSSATDAWVVAFDEYDEDGDPIEAIARAILAERQRCADKVKGAFLMDPNNNTNAINCYDAIMAS